ncbi:glutamyl aminopeptidase [Eurytemora carolleeae]|uniref:glutamyl aminopeptidase n=1 Tax=Eurytemora carolleeae TaxID=1294199 RepID=UPI000C7599C6|nr:glutamyl aminopeptidase [Eurytemora carolleeae]|eukprot:XP_023337478.1 glutamyl aminopeptidase-like [Eurytemora affinis]
MGGGTQLLYYTLILINIFPDCEGSTSLIPVEADGEPIHPEDDDTLVVPLDDSGEVFPWNEIRIPGYIRPISYQLTLYPDLDKGLVKGKTDIQFQVTEETDFIVLHSNKIQILKKTINNNLTIARFLEYAGRDQVYLETDNHLKPGLNYSISFEFQYNFTEGPDGFILSNYKNSDGSISKVAATNFDPISARKAFPCFDEPQLKAKFSIKISHPSSYKAYSNMPVKMVTPVKGVKDQMETIFAESPEMPTYTLSFAICDYAEITRNTSSNATIRIIAQKEKMPQAKFGLKLAENLLEFFAKYFGVPYPMPKLDLITLPGRAFENWGLVRFSEKTLLIRENVSSSRDTQFVALSIGHLLAHQWFGNLVTMQWWNDFWLKEGFVTWLQYKGVSESRPDWNMLDQFWSYEVQPALHLDALQSSHPIFVEVEDPRTISSIFDNISFGKGASLIRMLEQYLEEKYFRKGLEIYMTKYGFKNADAKDLWSSCSEATNKSQDIEGMMNTWTLQMGYPLITFTIVDDSFFVWNISQSRFLMSAQLKGVDPLSPKSPFDYKWVVPISFKTSAGTTYNVLLQNKNDTSKVVTLDEKIQWIKGNIDGVGFYRVNYPTQIWTGLIKQLKVNYTVFTGVERAQLIDDAFTLFMAGLLPASVPLSLCTYLVQEKDISPWTVAINQLNTWKRLLSSGMGGPAIEKFITYLIENIYDDLGWADTGDHGERMLRSKILTTAVAVGLEDAVDRAKDMFINAMETNTSIDSEYQALVFCTGIREGGKEEWRWVFHQYCTTNQADEKYTFRKSLACTRDTFILQRLLDISLETSQQIATSDIWRVLGDVAKNPSGTLLAWRHLRRFWNRYSELHYNNSMFRFQFH